MSLRRPGRSQAVNKAYDLLESTAGRLGPEGSQPGAEQDSWELEPGAGRASPQGRWQGVEAAGRWQEDQGGLSTGCAVQPGPGRKVWLPSGGQVGCRLAQEAGVTP